MFSLVWLWEALHYARHAYLWSPLQENISLPSHPTYGSFTLNNGRASERADAFPGVQFLDYAPFSFQVYYPFPFMMRVQACV